MSKPLFHRWFALAQELPSTEPTCIGDLVLKLQLIGDKERSIEEGCDEGTAVRSRRSPRRSASKTTTSPPSK